MEKGQSVTTLDRVNFSIGRKINVGKYETLDIFIGYGSDRQGSETIEDTFKRTEAKTIKEFEKLMAMVEKDKIKGGKSNGS